MKYRVINKSHDESFYIITEDGGVAYFYHNGKDFSTVYYQNRLTDCDPAKGDIYEQLSEGKSYYKDWEGEPTRWQVIQDALQWLVFPAPTKWEQDATLWTDFLPIDKGVVLTLYRLRSKFTDKDNELINAAIDAYMVDTTEIKEDFMDYITEDEFTGGCEFTLEEVWSYTDEHYANGLTHKQNLTAMLDFLKY